MLISVAVGTDSSDYWVPVRGFRLSYHNKETILLTIDPCYGNLNKIPEEGFVFFKYPSWVVL